MIGQGLERFEANGCWSTASGLKLHGPWSHKSCYLLQVRFGQGKLGLTRRLAEHHEGGLFSSQVKRYDGFIAFDCVTDGFDATRVCMPEFG